MDTKSLLLEDRPQHLKRVLKQIGKTEESLLEDVEILKQWLRTQPHLPEIPHDNMIENFLFFNKFSIERTKQKLDMYYTIRSLIPEIYENKHPNLPHMVETANLMYCFPLPKVTEEGYRVVIIKHVTDNPDNFEPYKLVAHLYNTLEIRMHEDVTIGDIVIYDFDNLRMGHLVKFTPTVLKNYVTVLEKVYSNRLKAVHYLNCPPYIDKVLLLVKQAVKPKIFSRIHLHKRVEQLFNFVSKQVVPEDYGGEEISMAKLNELWKHKLSEYCDRFTVLDKLRTNENLRPTELVNDEILGYYGNFKRLDIC